jgi:hypothetical protein
MKKLTSFLILFAFSFSAICQSTALSSDKQFITTLKKMNEVSRLIYSSNAKNLAEIKTFEGKIKLLGNDLSDAEYNTQLNNILNIPVNYDIVADLRMISKNVVELREKYKDAFSEKNIEEAVNEAGKVCADCGGGMVATGTSGGGDCLHPWKYGICAAGVTAAAILGASACSASTVIIGTPACVALTWVVAAAGYLACIETYCH